MKHFSAKYRVVINQLIFCQNCISGLTLKLGNFWLVAVVSLAAMTAVIMVFTQCAIAACPRPLTGRLCHASQIDT